MPDKYNSVPPRTPPYGLRLPPALKDLVQSSADANNRSMNAEIIARLEDAYSVPTVEQATAIVVAYLSGMARGMDGDKTAVLQVLNMVAGPSD